MMQGKNAEKSPNDNSDAEWKASPGVDYVIRSSERQRMYKPSLTFSTVMTLMDQNKNTAATKRYRSPIYAVTFSNHHQLKFSFNAQFQRYRKRTALLSIHRAVQFNTQHMFITSFAVPTILVLCKWEPVLNVNNGDAVNGTMVNGEYQHICECHPQADEFSTLLAGNAMLTAHCWIQYGKASVYYEEFGAR